ncbi:MAG: hypothetical protein IJ137_12445 [Eubacterium sp.]|nr:hypothetical protein [Eubacterium sp.]
MTREMIYLDIYVAAADESLEFRCDEKAPIASVCRDIYHTLTRRYGGEADRESDAFTQFWLCDPASGRVLMEDRSLMEEQVMNGSRLLFL